MALTKGFARNNAKTPLDQRLADMATIVCNAGGTPRTGVLGNANASIASALATWHFRVQAAEFVTSKGKADGVMIFTNDGVVDVPIAAGAPVSNSRIDVLWVKHEDNTTGDAASLPIFGVTSGAAAASPVKPAIPTGAEEIATLRAYSGTTGASGGANILTNTYKMTAGRGGIVPVRTLTERDAWTAPAPADGQFVLVLADNTTYQYVDSTIGWLHVAGKPVVSAVAFSTIYSGPNSRLVELGGRITLEGLIGSSSATFNAGTEYAIGTIPAVKAPIADRIFPVMIAGVFGYLKVTSAGAISFVSSATFTAPLPMNVSATWFDKRLG